MIYLAAIYPVMAGDAFLDAQWVAMNAPILAVGEAYEDGVQAAEDADIWIPPGEHPLDDENLPQG